MSSTGNENRELRTGWKRHTGVLEGTPSSEAALWDAHGEEMRERSPAMRYFSRPRSINHEGHEGLLKLVSFVYLRVLCGYCFLPISSCAVAIYRSQVRRSYLHGRMPTCLPPSNAVICARLMTANLRPCAG